MSVSISLPKNLQQQLNDYCKQHHLTETETICLAIKNLLTTDKTTASPYELGKHGFGADETHEGDIAQNTTTLLKLVHNINQ